MDNSSNHDSDIINKSDLEHIMADLSQDNQNFHVFLDEEEYIDINQMCDSTQEVKQESDHMEADHISESGLIISCPISCSTNAGLSTGVMPSTTDYPGPFNFEISIAGSSYRKGSWIYSSKLRKVFIDVNKVMLMKFKVDHNCPLGLRVRALLVYSSPDHMNQAVSRCTIHKFSLDPSSQAHVNPNDCFCQDYNLVGHVLVTDHNKAIYEFNPDSERHSVLVPLGLPQPGTDTFTVAYQFGCKNSCPGGMSRRAVNIIYTLETPNGDVMGRRCLSVKVCSCPKRDKEREEYEFDKVRYPVVEKMTSKKRGSNRLDSGGPSNKKMRSECLDEIKSNGPVFTMLEKVNEGIHQIQHTLAMSMDELRNLRQILNNIVK